MTPPSLDLKPLDGESFVEIPRRRHDVSIPGLWKPPGTGSPTALLFHSNLSRSFHRETRALAGLLGARGWGTLRILFRPMDWAEAAARTEIRRRLPMALAAVRWVRKQSADAPLLLAGTSMGAVLSARLAPRVGARGVILISPPFVSPRTPEFHRYWAGSLAKFRGPKLVVIGAEDDPWAPVDFARRVIDTWPRPTSLEVIPGAGHDLKGHEAPLREALAGWLRGQKKLRV